MSQELSLAFANYLQASGFGTVGSDIYIGQIPDGVNGIWVERIGGLQNNYVPMQEGVVNIYAKNTSATDAVTTLESIKNHVHRMHTTTAGDNFIYTMLVLGNIEEVSRDLEYAKIYKLTVQLTYKSNSVIS